MVETDVIEYTNTFLKRMRDGEFVFTAKATELKYVYGYESGDTQYQRALKTKPLAVCLDIDLNHFQNANYVSEKKTWAKKCKSWIQTMWLSGAIQEGSGAMKKLTDLKAENKELQEKLALLAEKYLDANKKLEMFEKKFPSLKDKR